MKALKVLSFAVGVVLALLASAAVAIRVLYPPERVKALALAKLSAALGREVRLAEAAASLRGATLKDLEVSEVPDFKAGTALAAAEVRVSPRWKPLLLRRELLIDELAVSGLAVSYSPKAAPAPAKGKEAEPAPKAAASAAFSVAKLSLEKGTLTYRDGPLEAVLSGLSVEASDVRPQGPVPFTLGFDFTYKSGKDAHAGRLDAEGTLDAAGGEPAKAVLELAELSVVVDGMRAGAKGRVDRLLLPEVKAELRLPAFKAGGFAVPALSGPLDAAMTEKGLHLRSLSLKGEGASLSLKAAQDKTRWKVSEAALKWGPFDVAASGTAGDALDLQVRLAPAPLAEAARLAPGATAYQPSGTLAADVAVKGSPAAPSVSGLVTLSSAAALYEGQRLSGVEARLRLAPGSAAGTVKGALNGLPFDAKLDAKGLDKAPDVRLDARLERLDLAALPSSAEKPEKKKSGLPKKLEPAKGPKGRPFAAAGSLAIGAIRHPNFEAAESKLSFDVKGTGSDPALLDGSVQLRVGPGRFEDLRLLGSDKPILKALLLPVIVLQKTASFIKIPLFPQFDTVKFHEIRGDYALKDGVLTVRESRLDGTVADAELSGKADLVKEDLDLRAKVRIGQQGGLKLGGQVGFKVTGTLSSPSVSVDPAALLKQPPVEKAVGEVLKQGENLLKGLFKK